MFWTNDALGMDQGVVAFLKGDSGTASTLLIRASEEAKALRPDPVLATRLVHQWRSLKFEHLQRKVSKSTLVMLSWVSYLVFDKG